MKQISASIFVRLFQVVSEALENIKFNAVPVFFSKIIWFVDNRTVSVFVFSLCSSVEGLTYTLHTGKPIQMFLLVIFYVLALPWFFFTAVYSKGTFISKIKDYNFMRAYVVDLQK